jgi:hypothetical protein
MASETVSADSPLLTDAEALPSPSPSTLPDDDPHSIPTSSPSPSPPTLAHLQQQAHLLTHQLHKLVTSIEARSVQYTSLTSSYLSLLSSSIDGVVEEAEGCCQLADDIMTQAIAMNTELELMDEVERAVRQSAEQVAELEKRMNRALTSQGKG